MSISILKQLETLYSQAFWKYCPGLHCGHCRSLFLCVLCPLFTKELPEHDEPVQQHHVSCQRRWLLAAPSLQQPWKASSTGTLWFAHRSNGGGECCFSGTLPARPLTDVCRGGKSAAARRICPKLESCRWSLQRFFDAIPCLTGLDALERTCWQTQTTGDGAGGGALPHSLCPAQRKLV